MKLKCLLVTQMWKVFGEFLRFLEFEIETHTRHTIVARRQDWRACFVCQNPHNTVLPNNSTPLAQLQNRKFSFFRTQLNSIAFSLSRSLLDLLYFASHTITDTLTVVGWLVRRLLALLCLFGWKRCDWFHWIRHSLHTRNPPSCIVFASI